LDPQAALASLHAARILVIGVGGTGSVVLQHLVGAGMRRFVLVDSDSVQVSNLGRQFIYRLSDVGRPKTDAAADYIKAAQADADIATFSTTISCQDDMSAIITKAGEISAAAVCIDTPPATAFDMTSAALWDAAIPFIHGGVMIQTGFFGPFFHTSRSQHPPSAFSSWKATTQPIDPTCVCFSPYNTIVSAYIARDLIHYITGCADHIDYDARSFINFQKLTLNKFGPHTKDRQ
jgi:sulfur-carrier protein adenylyltransferase/sulfurtransferase